MQEKLERQWQRASGYEESGNLAAARAIYESILRLDPGLVAPRMRLSGLEQVAGRYRASRSHALAAAAAVTDGREWNHLSNVSRRLLSFDEHDALHELILRADWDHPGILAHSAILSQHLWLTNHFEDALDLIEAACRRTRPSHVLSYSRANALRYCGRMDEATLEYERCLHMSPGYASAHWSLAHHCKADPPNGRVDRIRKAQSASAPDSPDQPYFHYALFKELDGAGETEQAWIALQTGARLKRQSIHYDARAERAGMAALLTLTASASTAHAARDQSSDRIPIFIVGLPRTGTTVMERILSNHDDVATGGELNDFNSALCWEADGFLGSAMNASAVERLSHVDFSNVGKTYDERTSAKFNGRRFLVDKNPANIFNVGYICRALPHARIICMRKSPMDACLSNMKELFSGNAYGYSYDLGELADHYLGYERIRSHWQQEFPENFRTVDYESLVSDPFSVARAAASFCGIEFDPGSVDIVKNNHPVSTASSSQVRQPIHSGGIGAWKRYSGHLESMKERFSGIDSQEF